MLKVFIFKPPHVEVNLITFDKILVSKYLEPFYLLPIVVVFWVITFDKVLEVHGLHSIFVVECAPFF